jgi:hypothetical protein
LFGFSYLINRVALEIEIYTKCVHAGVGVVAIVNIGEYYTFVEAANFRIVATVFAKCEQVLATDIQPGTGYFGPVEPIAREVVAQG